MVLIQGHLQGSFTTIALGPPRTSGVTLSWQRAHRLYFKMFPSHPDAPPAGVTVHYGVGSAAVLLTTSLPWASPGGSVAYLHRGRAQGPQATEGEPLGTGPRNTRLHKSPGHGDAHAVCSTLSVGSPRSHFSVLHYSPAPRALGRQCSLLLLSRVTAPQGWPHPGPQNP